MAKKKLHSYCGEAEVEILLLFIFWSFSNESDALAFNVLFSQPNVTCHTQIMSDYH